METVDLLLALLGVIGAPAVCATILLNWIGKRQKQEDDRSAARQTESKLILEGICSVGELALVTAVAWRDGKPNGALDKAVSGYSGYRETLESFLIEQNAQRNH